ncbi:flavodoxin [Selenomonas ruminantium]|uniref:Flavodoxin n=1 Tax=Selenomonas ruminantium TaxID=971 RepID=A0A1K1MFP0_SELRU|nr:flavodoxin [Selenomonas ruminantium]SFW21924.1 Flavodoxin [Selenomonas ruminantium]
MRKLWIACLGVLMILGLVGCGTESGKTAEKAAPVQTTAQADSKAPAAKGKILVAYFSATGNTRTLAENTAKVLNADLYEIRPEVPYSKEDLNYNDESTRATVEQKNDSARPKLADKNAPIANYDTIVLAYPIWWGQAPRIMDTFVESYDFTGKKLTAICTSGGSDIGTSADYLQKLTKGKAEWKAGKLFSPQAKAEEIKSWFNGLGL